ncbi:dynein regulatory complex subunit 5 [Pelobates fuscus]|uniref:dynein regulatory complex subunit 5 n=1 Tax=Pelobates fuscus TaxID=191477 RepID=UPI002FE47A70
MPDLPSDSNVSGSTPLPIFQRNPAADLRKMRRVITEDFSWSLAMVPPLSELCLQQIVSNFEKNPILDKLVPKHKTKVLDRISTLLPLKVTANLISDESYWKRCCAQRWAVCDISQYRGSWKRLYFERHLQNLIECFIPDLTDAQSILEVAELGKDYVAKLEIQQLLPPVKLEDKKEGEVDEISDSGSEVDLDLPSMDHFDLNLIANCLHGLEELHLVYGVKDCGVNFQWNLFNFTEQDCVSLAKALQIFKNLKVFRLNKSKVDDEKVRVLVRRLLNHPSLVHLDLSHNKISDRGARAVGKLMSQSQLRILNLCNNNVRSNGAQAIAHALSKNNSLTSLNLRLNHIVDEGGQALCQALLHNTSLMTLHLGSNELSEPTASVLSQVLSQNTTIKSISLSCNRIGLDGGKQLLEGITDNKTLVEFDLRLTEIGQESEIFINQVLQNNQEQARLEALEKRPPSRV